MTKKVTTISIDERVLVRAKQEIPNISDFCENCMRAYLGVGVNSLNISSMQEELNKLKSANLNLHLLSEVDLNNANNNELVNDAWRSIWRKTRNHMTVSDNELISASKILGKSSEELEQMLTVLVEYSSREDLIACEDWSFAAEKYNIL